MLLTPKPGTTYGPVRSRRLGRSLGINVLPSGRKHCSFNCIYCQYGWADPRRPLQIGDGVPSVEEVRTALVTALAQLDEVPEFLTFSGNGEPTLHPAFPSMVDEVVAVRDAHAPSARVAILSNSSQVADPVVRAALGKLDVRIMKLDVGREDSFQRFNQPAPGIHLDLIVDGLRSLGGVTLQSLFADGPFGNIGPEDVDAWIKQVQRVLPLTVQVYSLDRDVPSPHIGVASGIRLGEIRDGLLACGIRADVFQRTPPRSS